MNWISVETSSGKLPEFGELVLITDGKKIDVGRYKQETSEWWDQTNKTTQKLRKEVREYWESVIEGWIDVTHWQPLPEPPESE